MVAVFAYMVMVAMNEKTEKVELSQHQVNTTRYPAAFLMMETDASSSGPLDYLGSPLMETYLSTFAFFQ